MYWPNHAPHRRKTLRWRATGVLLVALLSVYIGGELNGWWQIPLTSNKTSESTAGVPQQTSPAVSAPERVEATILGPTPAVTALAAKSAPTFVLLDLLDETREVSLTDFAGQPVILNFWASWCVPCRVEMPALQRAYDRHREEGLVVLGINQSYIDDAEAARVFVEELALTFPNVRDETGYTSDTLYRTVGLPTSVFIDEKGNIIHRQIGQLTEEQIEALSQQLTAEHAKAP